MMMGGAGQHLAKKIESTPYGSGDCKTLLVHNGHVKGRGGTFYYTLY